MFVAIMSSYIPLYILLFKTTEDNISEERKLFNKIKELKKENEELKAKLAQFNTENKYDTDDEKLSIQKPLSDDEGDNEGDDEGDAEDDAKGKVTSNNLLHTIPEDLHFGRL
jgi:hypothetical protein